MKPRKDSPVAARCAWIASQLEHTELLTVLAKAGIDYVTFWRWREGRGNPRLMKWEALKRGLPPDLRADV